MNKNSQVLLQWNEERQVIDGFGVSEAGWSYPLWAHKKRDELMGWLFGEEGLRLNMLRGQIFPHYSPAPGEYQFDVNADIDIPVDNPLFDEVDDPDNPPADLERRGQLWVTREAKKTFGVDKLIFSTWTPPAYMKTPQETSGGTLNKDYDQSYTEYLSEFCKAFESVGLKPYAISPVNEPEFPATWNSCLWDYKKLADFLMDVMGPFFNENHPDIEIFFGENGQWYFPGGSLLGYGSKTYVANIIKRKPNLNQYVRIAAGHGYPLPLTWIDPPIIPFTEAVNKGMKVWQTEISRPSDDGFLPGIENGLSWAARYNKYLTEAEVNAFLWWAGAQPNYSSETLIGIDKDNGREGYEITKRFDTIGNFTRYIKEGSIRIEIPTSGLPDNVDLSAYKKDDEYVIVMINPNNETVVSTLTMENIAPTGSLQRIVTDADHRWLETPEVPLTDNAYVLELPPMSVVTFIGKTTTAQTEEAESPVMTR